MPRPRPAMAGALGVAGRRETDSRNLFPWEASSEGSLALRGPQRQLSGVIWQTLWERSLTYVFKARDYGMYQSCRGYLQRRQSESLDSLRLVLASWSTLAAASKAVQSCSARVAVERQWKSSYSIRALVGRRLSLRLPAPRNRSENQCLAKVCVHLRLCYACLASAAARH